MAGDVIAGLVLEEARIPGPSRSNPSGTNGWLDPTLVLARPVATGAPDLARTIAEAVAHRTGLEQPPLEAELLRVLKSDAYGLGGGVAVPHFEAPGLAEPAVCVVVLDRPLDLPSPDLRPIDLLFVILSPAGDRRDRLLLLAHLAKLTQGQELLEALRKAESADEAVRLIRTAEAVPATPVPAPLAATHALVVISMSGENAVDALLVHLLDLGHGDACILDAQSLGEAATREVPLFTGFRDIFGDPGGRRVLLLEIPTPQVDAVMRTVRKVTLDHRAKDARVTVLPAQAIWELDTAPVEEGAGGH